MVVRIDNGYTSNFYEGGHIGIHELKTPEGKKTGISIVIEGMSGQNCLTIELDNNEQTWVFLMNSQGKTIEKIFI